MRMEDLLANDDWKRAERTVAERFRLNIHPAAGVLLKLLRDEAEQSDFPVDDVLAVFTSQPEKVVEFGLRWYADCGDRDYGEEWDPDEGNQQEEDQERETVGIAQGFLVGYTMLYLYTKYRPEGLAAYIKRCRIPHATEVAGDVKRVFASMNETGAEPSLAPDG